MLLGWFLLLCLNGGATLQAYQFASGGLARHVLGSFLLVLACPLLQNLLLCAPASVVFATWYLPWHVRVQMRRYLEALQDEPFAFSTDVPAGGCWRYLVFTTDGQFSRFTDAGTVFRYIACQYLALIALARVLEGRLTWSCRH
jgi:hypothetical protein